MDDPTPVSPSTTSISSSRHNIPAIRSVYAGGRKSSTVHQSLLTFQFAQENPEVVRRECVMLLNFLKTIVPIEAFRYYFEDDVQTTASDRASNLVSLDANGCDVDAAAASAESRLILGLRDGAIFSFLAYRLFPLVFPSHHLHAFDHRDRGTQSIAKFNSCSEDLFGEDHELSPAASQRRFAIITDINALLMKLSSSSVRFLPSHHQITAAAIMGGEVGVVVDLLWQLVRAVALQNVDVDRRPELIWLMHDDLAAERKLSDLFRYSKETLLLQWVNYHLAKSGSVREVTSFATDFNDAVVYAILVGQVAADGCDQEILRAILELPYSDGHRSQEVAEERFKLFLLNLRKLDLDLGFSSKDLANGHARSHLLLLSILFDRYPGLVALPREEDWMWLQEQIQLMTDRHDSLSEEYDSFRTQIAHEISAAREKTVEEQSLLRQQAKEQEMRLRRLVETLQQTMNDQRNTYIQEYDQLNGDFDRYRNSVDGSLSRTHRLLSAYFERRQQIFKEANVYTISAFNNQGKRITFNIPAPALKSKCIFSVDELVDEHPSPMSSRGYSPSALLAMSSSCPAGNTGSVCQSCSCPLGPSVSTPTVIEGDSRPTTAVYDSAHPLETIPEDPDSGETMPSSAKSKEALHGQSSNSSQRTFATVGVQSEFEHAQTQSPPLPPLLSARPPPIDTMAPSRRRCNSAPPDVLLDRVFLSTDSVRHFLDDNSNLSSALVSSSTNSVPMMTSFVEVMPSTESNNRNSRTLSLTVQSIVDLGETEDLDKEIASLKEPAKTERPRTRDRVSLIAVAEEISAHPLKRTTSILPPTSATASPTLSPAVLGSGEQEWSLDAFDLPSDIHKLVVWLVEDNVEKLQQIQLLAAKVDEMTWLNQVMGDKIRTFSEQLIQNKQMANKPRRSKTRIFRSTNSSSTQGRDSPPFSPQS